MKHVLYKTGDTDTPAMIKDENGCVVLSMCRFCGLAEAELEEVKLDQGCKVKRDRAKQLTKLENLRKRKARITTAFCIATERAEKATARMHDLQCKREVMIVDIASIKLWLEQNP